jgi:DNA-binding ferritin-like protein
MIQRDKEIEEIIETFDAEAKGDKPKESNEKSKGKKKEEKKKDPFEEEVNEFIASLYTHKQNSLGAHLMITGSNFLSLHKLLGEHYKELVDWIDNISENLRYCNKTPVFHLSDVEDITTLEEMDVTCGCNDAILEEICYDIEELINLANNLASTLESKRNRGFTNVIDDFITSMTLFIYKFRSSISKDNGTKKKDKQESDKDDKDEEQETNSEGAYDFNGVVYGGKDIWSKRIEESLLIIVEERLQKNV